MKKTGIFVVDVDNCEAHPEDLVESYFIVKAEDEDGARQQVQGLINNVIQWSGWQILGVYTIESELERFRSEVAGAPQTKIA